MGNGVSGDQGNLPSYGKRDVGVTFDRKQHDWSEQARAQEVNSLMSNANSYTIVKKLFVISNGIRSRLLVNKVEAIWWGSEMG